MTQIEITFACPTCATKLALNPGNGRLTVLDRAGDNVDPPEAKAADATATSPAPRAPRKPLPHAELRARTLQAIRHAGRPITRNRMAQMIGVTKGSRAYAVGIPQILAELLEGGYVEPGGTNRGHPCYRLTITGVHQALKAAAIADPSPPTAAADDTSPSAAAPDDTSPVATDDTSPGSQRRLPSTPTTAQRIGDQALEQRTTRRREEADARREGRRDQLLALLDEHGELTMREIAEHMGVNVTSLTSLRQELERRGRISWRRAKPGTEQPLWYRVPLPAERGDVEITQAGRSTNGSLQGRVMAQLAMGAKNVPELAKQLDAHPALIAQAVSMLQREGEVQKQPGGRYLRVAM